MDSNDHNIFGSKLFLFLSNDDQYDEPKLIIMKKMEQVTIFLVLLFIRSSIL